MQLYRRRPVEVRAIRFTGSNLDEIAEFVGEMPPHRDIAGLWESSIYRIITIEGKPYASPGDWLIKHDDGSIRPCPNAKFVAIYEEVEEDQGVKI